MEKKSYTYGSKLAGMILHLFFTVILTIAVYLLASLISKNILQVTDIGTDDFFNSGYYTKCMEQKCSELTDYLHLLQKGNKRSAEDDKRYLQYTNEFKREDTNFWRKRNLERISAAWRITFLTVIITRCICHWKMWCL